MSDPMRIRAQVQGDKTTVRVLVSHEMESGQRRAADARLRAPGELGPRDTDAQRPLHVAEGVRPLLWAPLGGLVLGGLVLGGHVPGLLVGAVPVLAPRAGFGLHRGALTAAQVIKTGGRRRPRPLATSQVARARTQHLTH